MEVASLSDDPISPGEDEDLTLETAKIIVRGDICEASAVGSRFGVSRVGDVWTCSFEVGASILVGLTARAKHTSAGSRFDVLHSVCMGKTFG